MKDSRVGGAALATIVLLLSLFVMPIQAADESEDAKEEGASRQEYVEVNVSYIPTSNTIATKLPIPLQMTPANVGVVNSMLLQEQDAAVLGDALRNVSGLNVQTGTGVHDFFVIRGFDSLSSGLVLNDGAAEPEVTYYPMYNVEGVEVLKGPAGFLYGSNPLAGAVNIVRKQPLPADLGVFSLSGGSFGTYDATGDWNLSTRDGDLNFRLNALYKESDGYRDDKESEHVAINPSLAWRIGEDSTLNFNLEWVDAEYSPDSGLPLLGLAVPDVDRKTSYQTPLDFSNQEILRAQVDFETRLSENISLRNKTYFRELDWDTAGTQLFGAVPLSTEVIRGLTALDDRQQYVGNQLEFVFELGGGRVRHNLLAGLEIAQLTDEFAIDTALPCFPTPSPGCVPTIDAFDPVETIGVPGYIPFMTGDATSEIVAPYVVDQIELSPKVQVQLGARYDRIDYETSGIQMNFDTFTPLPYAIDRNDGEISPHGGVAYAISDSFTLYANGGKSFAPPAPRAIDIAEPEESVQFEIGAKKSFMEDKIRTTFSLYDIDRENIGIPNADGVTQQTGDQTARGFEFELAAEPLPRLRAFVSYAYNDAELEEFTQELGGFVVDFSGNTPAFAPEHLVNSWVSYRFKNGFGLGGGVRYIGEQYNAEDNFFEIDDSIVVDAALFYDLDHVRFKLNLKNLTDEEYFIRGFGSQSVIPADEFAAYVGIELRM
ncbi:MAG: TonB-dependent siderophore receptor [bacterium]|nr:TonB-dependent siderophore receptor [bacterium]